MVSTKIVKGRNGGHRVALTIGHQTFFMEDKLEELDEGLTSEKYAEFYEKQLRKAFKNLHEIKEHWVFDPDNPNIRDARQEFIELIGKEAVEYIIGHNEIRFEVKNPEIYKKNEIDINFLETDSVGDVVTHHTISYNYDTKSWYSDNCIDLNPKGHSTFLELKTYIESLRSKFVDNGFYVEIDLPNKVG